MDPNVLHNISYGIFIACSYKDKGRLINGQIVNTCFQITSDPVIIAISINKENFTHEFIKESGRFSVSILSESTPLNLIGKFGFRTGRKIDKFEGVKYEKLESGCPVILEHTIGYIELEVTNEVGCWAHTLFIGKMVDSKMISSGPPMTYDYYHHVKRGTTPKSAPTFIKEEGMPTGGMKMDRYRCEVCNYVYDPSNGDPDNGVQPGTKFEDIPDTWVCPVCGAGKEQFVKEG